MQGTILAAIGSAVTSVPTWIGILLVLSAHVAPLTLGALAFGPELQSSIVSWGPNTAVLIGFTVAWIALAVTVLCAERTIEYRTVSTMGTNRLWSSSSTQRVDGTPGA